MQARILRFKKSTSKHQRPVAAFGSAFVVTCAQPTHMCGLHFEYGLWVNLSILLPNSFTDMFRDESRCIFNNCMPFKKQSINVKWYLRLVASGRLLLAAPPLFFLCPSVRAPNNRSSRDAALRTLAATRRYQLTLSPACRLLWAKVR